MATEKGDKEITADVAKFELRAQTLDPNAPELYSRVMWRNWFPVGVAMLTLAACGYDQSMSWDIPLLSAFTTDITAKNAVSLATFDSLTNYSGMMAAVFMPFAYDWKGRKFGFMIGNIIAFIGSAISVFGTLDVSASNVTAMYYTGRFIAVLGISLSAGCSWMYASEIAHPAHRAFFGGLFGICWSVGNLINNIIIFGMTYMEYSSWQWRIPTLMQAVFSLVCIVLIPFIPESPRTLMSKGKTDEAEKVVREWVGCNVGSDKFVRDQMEELRIKFENAPKNETILETYNMKPLWATANAQRRVFFFILTNAILNLFNVGATGGVFVTLIYDDVGLGQDRQKTAISLANTVFGIICGYVASTYLDTFGRRKMYLLAYGISFFLGFITAGALEGYRDSGGVKGYSYVWVAMIFVGTLYSSPMGPVKLLFESELLAYSYRAKGKALNDFTGKPSSVILTYIQSAVYTAIDTRSYWVAQGYIALFFVLHWFIMPETKNRTLEEVDEIFDHPSPFYTEWFNRKSGETNYVKYSLDLLKAKDEEAS
ncbi:hypothetical protein HK100_001556 [Physocladia obscura]|uniref:Major facilitator superfamily (MFS) profile domain-containing protein n=1 Tax=Physocladia obscura TaxID=109957 RepID=A0AAD5SWZ8_9FUNG|nr:hypothetical protein HK100_001556 [Physocladia obscura]